MAKPTCKASLGSRVLCYTAILIARTVLVSMGPGSVAYPPTAQCKGKFINEQLFPNETVMDNWPGKINWMLSPGIPN